MNTRRTSSLPEDQGAKQGVKGLEVADKARGELGDHVQPCLKTWPSRSPCGRSLGGQERGLARKRRRIPSGWNYQSTTPRKEMISTFLGNSILFPHRGGKNGIPVGFWGMQRCSSTFFPPVPCSCTPNHCPREPGRAVFQPGGH